MSKMKTIFIINDAAGKNSKNEKLKNEIRKAAEELQAEVEIYSTKGKGDATNFVKQYCEKNGAARFIACGGDGTLSEVVNGAISYENAEFGVIPMGTGNDFCRNFENCDFFNIALQILGKCEKCDAIKYSTYLEGKEIIGYGVNMFNIGFDCNVVDTTNKVKQSTFLSGPLSYFVSIFINLINKKCTDLKIELDGIPKYNGPLLLTCIANGCYCGGGIKSNPLAKFNDGLININIIKNVPSIKFISLLPSYMNGTFLSKSNIEKIVLSEKCSKVNVTPYSKNIRICVDGDIIDASQIKFEAIHNAFNFVVPKNI